MKIKILLGMLFSLTMMTIYGCGGGGGAGPTVVSGVAAAGPFNGGQVQVFAINEASGSKGALLKTVTTDTNGAFTADISPHVGPVLIEVTGSFKDEATGATVTIDQTAPLRAAISNAAGATTAMVTPLTELAVKEAGAVLSRANIDKANADITTLFKVGNIITTKPADATVAASATAPAAEKDHGLVLATISQMGKDSGKTMAQVLADMSTAITGATMPVTTTAGFKAAMFNFISDTNINKTGITPATATTINPTTVQVAVLKISRAGGGAIGGMDFTVTLPGDVTVGADAAATTTIKPTSDGTVSVSGAAATGANVISASTFDATSKKLRVILANPNGFAEGQMVTVACTVPAASTITPEQLRAAVSSPATLVSATDLAGVPVAGVTLTAAAPVFF